MKRFYMVLIFILLLSYSFLTIFTFTSNSEKHSKELNSSNVANTGSIVSKTSAKNEIPISSGDYDPIDISNMKSGTFVVCKDNVPVYSDLGINENNRMGENYFSKGVLVKMRDLREGKWALVMVDPTIIYIEMTNLCRWN